MPNKPKKDLLAGVEGVKSSKFVGCNTLEVHYENGNRAIRYHYTDVITEFPDGTTTLTSGGWRTVTTKERLNGFTPLHFSSNKGIWFVYGDNLEKVPFVDEMVFDAEWNLISEVPKFNFKKVDRIKKNIAKYIKRIDKLEEIPFPNGGDCWDCSMRTVAEGKPMGDAFGKIDHLESHLKEGYIHGSIIYNALEEKGYPNPAIIMQMNLKLQIKQALRRYLIKRLLPEVQAV